MNQFKSAGQWLVAIGVFLAATTFTNAQEPGNGEPKVKQERQSSETTGPSEPQPSGGIAYQHDGLKKSAVERRSDLIAQIQELDSRRPSQSLPKGGTEYKSYGLKKPTAERRSDLIEQIQELEKLKPVPDDRAVRNRPVILRAEAFAGTPYGVGKFTFRLQPGDELVDRTEAILVKEANSRVLYPIVAKTAFQSFIQNISGNRESVPSDVHTVWFLFQGEGPLKMTLEGTDATQFEVPVEFVRPRQFDRRVKQWWQAFNRVVNRQISAGDYPPMVQAYLKALVGKRFGLPPAEAKKRNPDPLYQTFALMFDVESLRTETIESAMLNGVPNLPVDRPLPEPIQWSPVVVKNLPQAVAVEPIAKCIPEECFYLRFGTWGHNLWLQRLMEEFGGDLSRMIQVRGFKYRIQSKFLDQLAIQSTEWDQLFGGRLIEDVAVIGLDTYFDSGSAVGVVLQAKTTNVLKNNLLKKRKAFAAANQQLGVEIREIQVGDATIEFLSTPDNRYRSFYVICGDSHLITTSLTMAKRFLEAGQGKGSLADSEEYRFARYNLPLERDDTVFIYLSTKFFQNLLTPQYQIELRRRNRIATDMMLLELAQLAAGNEGYSDTSLEGLVKGGYLPNGFGYRPDGGTFETIGSHWHDSIRGRRGFFSPIPDLPMTLVNQEEVDWFSERATFFAESIRSLDPMFIAIKRFELKNDVERIVFDARLAPFGEEKYGWLISMLGKPLMREVNTVPGDIATFQASMKGGTMNQNIPPHQIFAGIQDRIDPAVNLQPSSMLSMMKTLRQIPGYLGSWPNPGYADWMPALGGTPDEYGYTYSRLLKLWRLQWDAFSVLSFDANRLEALKPHLKIVPSDRPAQLRLTVGDLSQSNLSGWANSVNYQRSWQTSIANVQLLNFLVQQFHVTPEAAKIIVERMLDVELVCSLGGDYELAQIPSGRNLWLSSEWPSFQRPELPPGHIAPFLTWFRGVQIEVTKAETQFSVHGFLDIQRNAEESSPLPSFDMFKGFGNLFGSGNQANKKKGEQKDEQDKIETPSQVPDRNAPKKAKSVLDK